MAVATSVTSARWPSMIDHAFQHLRCNNNRRTSFEACRNDSLLCSRNFFEWDLNTQITASDHDHISGFDNSSEILKSSRMFDLRNNPSVDACGLNSLTGGNQICSTPNIRDGNKIDVLRKRMVETIQVVGPLQGVSPTFVEH